MINISPDIYVRTNSELLGSELYIYFLIFHRFLREASASSNYPKPGRRQQYAARARRMDGDVAALLLLAGLLVLLLTLLVVRELVVRLSHGGRDAGEGPRSVGGTRATGPVGCSCGGKCSDCCMDFSQVRKICKGIKS